MSATKTMRRGGRKAPEADLGFDWGSLNSLLLALGVAVIAIGYVALSRGSVTLAPVLLILGYCVLIPASLLWRGRKAASGE
jgi:Flp pilus assembly protein TadB